MLGLVPTVGFGPNKRKLQMYCPLSSLVHKLKVSADLVLFCHLWTAVYADSSCLDTRDRKKALMCLWNITLHLKRDLEGWLKSLAGTKIFKIMVNMEKVQTGTIFLLFMFQLSCNFKAMVLRQSEAPGQVADRKPPPWRALCLLWRKGWVTGSFT